ncbi:MAG TPA: hypothetical protein VMF61_10830 [Candidatus Acidoferrales bacterium]|nr:hypothetical protein [Candidatus Acidoferrales bacterium]
MSGPSDVAVHLILGPREEPFLAALLQSLEGAAQTLIVNDNAPGPSPHAATIAASAFGAHAIVDRSPFTGFADARNRCLALHARHSSASWVAFADADEVHAGSVARVAGNLDRLPAGYDFVDAYTWHFFASFDYYTSIERRMAFFRFVPGAHWEGAVHERLTGLRGKRLALPYVYGHYGHTLAPRRHAEKGRLYSSLGAQGKVLREDDLDDFDVETYFESVYPRLLRFGGQHPPAARATVERLRVALRADHALTERVVAEQPLGVKARNVLRKLNYEMRWRGRGLNPLARRMLTPPRRPSP